MEGRKIFNFPFVATKQGIVTIPPISFAYFDFESKTYKTISTESISIKVGPPHEKGFDISKVSANITNYKYLLILPAVLLVVLLIWLAKNLFKKKQQGDKMVEAATALIEQETNLPVVTPQPAEEEVITVEQPQIVLTDILLIQDDKAFYTKAKEILSNTNFDTNTDKDKAISLCNEALYSPFGVSNREAVTELLRKLL